MAPAKKRTPKVEEVRPYVEGVAKNLVDKLYGPDGPAWGTKLTEIEDLFLAIREALTERMLADALARQAAAPAGTANFSTRGKAWYAASAASRSATRSAPTRRARRSTCLADTDSSASRPSSWPPSANDRLTVPA